MNFLFPLLLFGAAAIAAPIWLHLRRKSQERLVKFSAVRFLDDQPVPKESPLTLRDFLLFSLRALAVALIALAFAWPFAGVDPERVVTASKVLILDNTLSNQAEKAFEENRNALLKELRNSGPETQVAVIELTSQARVLANLGDSKEHAISKVEALKPSYQRGSYLSAFRQAASILTQALGEVREIVFYGDQQKNQWTENINTAPFIPSEVRVRLAREPGPEKRPNLALSEPQVRTFFLGNSSQADFAVKLTHSGNPDTATVTLKANGETIFRKVVDLKGQQEAMVLRAQWPVDPKQWVTGEVEVTGPKNDLLADDKVYFSLAPVQEGSIAVLSQSRFLKSALAPEVMAGRWKADVYMPASIAAAANAPNMSDVLVIDANYLQSKDARNLILRYLNNGHGVLLMLNRLNPLVHGFLRELGFEIAAASNGMIETNKKPTKFQYIAGLHPILSPFMSPDFGNLLEVDVLEHVPIRGEGLPLIFAENGDALLVQGAKFKGRLMVFAFGFERAQTDWATEPTFLPFLDLCLQHARANAAPQETAEPGDAVVYDVGVAGEVKEVTLRQGETVVRKGTVDEARRVTVTAPELPGVYSVYFDKESEPKRMLSVNVPGRESDLEYTKDMNALSAWQLPDDAPAKKPEQVQSNVLLALRAAVYQQKFWWWLLILSLLALAGEMCSLIWRKKVS